MATITINVDVDDHATHPHRVKMSVLATNEEPHPVTNEESVRNRRFVGCEEGTVIDLNVRDAAHAAVMSEQTEHRFATAAQQQAFIHAVHAIAEHLGDTITDDPKTPGTTGADWSAGAMKPINEPARKLAEATARTILKMETIDLPEKKLVDALRLLSRAFIEARDQIRALHDLVDLTDPNDPVGTALTKVGLERRPADPPCGKPRLVRSPEPAPQPTKSQVAALSVDDLRALYCRTMHEPVSFFAHATYVVRVWDGIDGCWANCTGEIGQDAALRYWAACTDGGAHHVTYAEIDYYRIFPGGTRMHFDGSDGREMHR